MPLYEYECEACGQRFELIRKFSDPPVDVCTLCGKGPVIRLFSSPAIQFKGSGFYITDYAKKGEGSKGEGGQARGKGARATRAKPLRNPSRRSPTARRPDFLTKSDSKSDSTAKPESSTPATPAKSSGSAKD